MMSNESKDKTGKNIIVNRREFFWTLGSGAMAITGVGSAVLSFQYLSPNVLLEPPMRFKAGKPEDFPPGSVTLDTKKKIFVVRESEGYFYALSAVCTHLGCLTKYKTDEDVIACPCHGSTFSKAGELLTGPAPKSLQRILIEMNDRGELVVDKSVVVDDDKILKV